MEAQQQDNLTPFQEQQGNTIKREIMGLIPLVIEACVDAEVVLATPAQRDTPGYRQSLTMAMAQFYQYMGRLFRLTKEMYGDDPLKDELLYWWNHKKVGDMEDFHKGLILHDKLQEFLYDNGLKDTNESKTTRFPFNHYLKYMEEKDG